MSFNQLRACGSAKRKCFNFDEDQAGAASAFHVVINNCVRGLQNECPLQATGLGVSPILLS